LLLPEESEVAAFMLEDIPSVVNPVIDKHGKTGLTISFEEGWRDADAVYIGDIQVMRHEDGVISVTKWGEHETGSSELSAEEIRISGSGAGGDQQLFTYDSGQDLGQITPEAAAYQLWTDVRSEVQKAEQTSRLRMKIANTALRFSKS